MSAKWTEADIPDQTGRLAVITGANSGIGEVTARELARSGASVVLACRDRERGASAAALLIQHVPDARVEVGQLDLADLASVRGFAEDIRGRYDRLDLLINNAGVMGTPYRRTADGFELQLGTNHLGHFALTGLLLPLLVTTPGARVVTVSSNAHRNARIDFGDLKSERNYGKWRAYGQSKLANLLFAFELQRRLDGANITQPLSMAAHPGFTATNLATSSARMHGSALRERIMMLSNDLLGQDVERGALPTLFAATKLDLPGGTYVGPDGMLELHGHPKVVSASRAARDRDTAVRLWEESERLTGVRYAFAV